MLRLKCVSTYNTSMKLVVPVLHTAVLMDLAVTDTAVILAVGTTKTVFMYNCNCICNTETISIHEDGHFIIF